MSTALCTPNTSQWSNATSATVQHLDTPFSDRTLPVEHRVAGFHAIQKSQYSQGVILIPNDHDPASVPAILPVQVTAGSSGVIELDPNNPDDNPGGGGLIFV